MVREWPDGKLSQAEVNALVARDMAAKKKEREDAKVYLDLIASEFNKIAPPDFKVTDEASEDLYQNIWETAEHNADLVMKGGR